MFLVGSNNGETQLADVALDERRVVDGDDRGEHRIGARGRRELLLDHHLEVQGFLVLGQRYRRLDRREARGRREVSAHRVREDIRLGRRADGAVEPEERVGIVLV